MTSWATFLAAVAVVCLVVIPMWGAIKFSPHHARSVKYAEVVSDKIVQKHVAMVSLGHPEYVRSPRIDRHPFYVAPAIGVWCYAWCVVMGAPLTSNVATLAAQTRMTMATCFIIGASLVLTGCVLGAEFGGRRIMPSVHDHLTAEVLGDDIVLPYWLAIAGLGATAVSLTIYSTTSFKSTTGSLGGWLTGVLACACVVTAPLLYVRLRRFQRDDAHLIAAAIARLERDGYADQ